MLSIALTALLPIAVTFLLGFAASWRRDFQPKGAAILNRLVLLGNETLALTHAVEHQRAVS